MHVLLLGAGEMAKQYIKVLKTLGVCFTVVGRSEERAKYLSKEMGVPVLTGGIAEAYTSIPSVPTHAIIATNIENLSESALFLLDKNIKNILVEKPGSMDLDGLTRVCWKAERLKSSVFIAYNRRFYSSVLQAEKRIKSDGGLLSFTFDFTEWSHIITGLNKPTFELENWFIANSTHVLDLAFFFGGKPNRVSSFAKGELDWHKQGSIFTGCGVTEGDIPFSYHANWEAPGSWKLELLTKDNKYIFRPLEKLQVQKKGSLDIDYVDLDDAIDHDFKPGLYRQVQAFLYKSEMDKRLLQINEAVKMMKIYYKMMRN
ncbi:Gfo/Idh/MocA family oxidoreductase [Aciduricibacillus chroicocephali]|uniref:Gfo/Idh/MocA family oxidoreductase n=1 Tax=Aciduricibacillus chroicocephali TaxID=3054939 RepID=A0ABY9KX64_9BACI|nr:Gfo/Idh/MocA family oxidoreductase [Bacillaceae bacterium 44XB]